MQGRQGPMGNFMSAALISAFSFRGRSNRIGFLASVLAIGAMQLVVAGVLMLVHGPARMVGEAVLLVVVAWLLAAAFARRLHDTGRGGWHLLAGLATSLLGTVLAAMIGIALFPLQRLVVPSPELGVVVLLASVVPFILTSWLHVARGSDGDNDYGPVPAAVHMPSRDAGRALVRG